MLDGDIRRAMYLPSQALAKTCAPTTRIKRFVLTRKQKKLSIGFIGFVAIKHVSHFHGHGR